MPAGRPCKLTPDVQEAILLLVRRGNYIETAAAAAGIRKDTLYAWMRKGARAKAGSFRKFSDAIKKALAESEAEDLRYIEESDQWTARAWRLERRFPKRWGRREEKTINRKQHVKITITEMVIDNHEDAQELIRSLAGPEEVPHSNGFVQGLLRGPGGRQEQGGGAGPNPSSNGHADLSGSGSNLPDAP